MFDVKLPFIYVCKVNKNRDKRTEKMLILEYGMKLERKIILDSKNN